MKIVAAVILSPLLYSAIIICFILFGCHHTAHAQGITNAPAISVDPVALQNKFTAWNAGLLLIGGTIWHVILKIAPWAKANGGLARGIRDFIWKPDTKPAAPDTKQ